jgi:branched-subunit amino acid transport protein
MNNIAIIITIGIGTYLLRLSFIGIVGDRAIPEWALVPLRFVAPAVLAALIAPAVLLNEGSFDVSPASNPRAVAALVALVLAWKTRSVPVVIAAGLMTVWALQALF